MTAIRNSICAAILVSSLFAVPSVAQEFPDSHLDAAKLASANAPIARDLDTVLPLLAQRVQNRLIQLRPDLHETISGTVQDVALRLAARRADLDSAIALVWARAFSEEELEVIAEFYTSPAGLKFGNLGPQLGQATIQTVDNWSSRIGEEMLDKTREELKKQGHEF